MRFACSRDRLAAVFQRTAEVVPAKSLKPVLTQARISLREGTLEVCGTDLEVAIRQRLTEGLVVEEEGEILVDPGRLASIIRESSDEEIRFERDEKELVITLSDGFYRIACMEVEEFPAVPEFTEGIADIEGGLLADMLQATIIAATTEKEKYALNGVLLEFEGNKIRTVATDGRRLAVREEKISSSIDHKEGIIPLRGVNILRKTCEQRESVSISLTENMAAIRTDDGSIEVFARLIEGRFPPYKKVIPSDNEKKVTVDREDFIAALRRASLLFGPADTKTVRFEVTPDRLRISSRTPEIGQAEIVLNAQYDGPAMDISFDPAFILDALKATKEDTVTLELKSSADPCLIRENGRFIYVVMPVRDE